MSQTPLLQASQSEPSINRKRPRFIGLAIDCTKSSPIVTGLVKNITKSFPIRLLTGKLPLATFSVTTAILLAAATTGCNNDGIAVYEAPKDAGFAHLHEGHNHASEAPFDLSSRAPGIEFKLPEGWQEQAPGSQIQVANIRISEGDEQAQVTVVPLPDISQNELQVVNIWRESLGMEPATEADLPSLKQATIIGPVEGVIYDFLADPDSGQMPTNANRILVGIANHQQLSWFFKMTGSEEFVGQQADNFRTFLSSVDFTSVPAPPPMTSGMATSSAPRMGTNSLPEWAVPDGWTPQTPGPMVMAAFGIDAETTVSVSALPGEIMGGLLNNANRWRGQVGLGPASAAEMDSFTRKLDVPLGEGTLVDLANKGADKRMVVVIVVHNDRTWYFKLNGSPSTTDNHLASFIEFVRSTDFNHG